MLSLSLAINQADKRLLSRPALLGECVIMQLVLQSKLVPPELRGSSARGCDASETSISGCCCFGAGVLLS